MSAQLTATAGSRRLALTALGDVVDVWSVEWPTGEWPRRYRAYRLAPDRLSLELLVDAAPAAAEAVSIEYGALHTVTASESSIPAEDDALVLHGAYGYACLAYGTPAADNFRYQDGAPLAEVDDSGIIGRWHAAGRAALGEFEHTLATLRRRRAQACQQRAAWRMRDE
jgi:hypothetical protein